MVKGDRVEEIPLSEAVTHLLGIGVGVFSHYTSNHKQPGSKHPFHSISSHHLFHALVHPSPKQKAPEALVAVNHQNLRRLEEYETGDTSVRHSHRELLI